MYLEEISIYWLWKRKRLQRVEFSTINIFTSSFILKQWHSNQLLRGRQGHLKSSCHRTQTLYMSCFECRTQKTWNLGIVCQPNCLSCVITFDSWSSWKSWYLHLLNKYLFYKKSSESFWLLFSGVTCPICEIKSCSAKHFARGKDKAKYSRVR